MATKDDHSAEAPQTIEQPLKSIAELPLKQKVFALLRENGLSIEDAGKALEYTKNSAYTMNARLKKYDLTDKKLVSAAHRSLKKLVRGQTVGDVEKVKDSTVLGAIGMIYDRYQPAVKQVEGGNTNTFVQVNIDSLSCG